MDVVEVSKKIGPQIAELFKKELDALSFIEKADDGWLVRCDMLEKKSIPETFDLLRIFELKLDSNARIKGYKEVGRRRRGDMKEE